MSWYNIMGQDKLPLSSFSVGHLLLGMRPALRVIRFPSEPHLGKTRFSFANGFQWVIAAGLGMECIYFETFFSFILVSMAKDLPILFVFTKA